MSLPVHILIKDRKEENLGKMKIIMGSVVTEKIGEIEDKAREGRSRRMRKEVVECALAVVGKKKF